MAAEQPTAPLAQRLLWFAGLWLAGVGTVAVVALIAAAVAAPMNEAAVRSSWKIQGFAATYPPTPP